MKAGVGSATWEKVAVELGVDSETLRIYVHMYRYYWKFTRIHHALMQTLEDHKLLKLGFRKGVFNKHQLNNLMALPFNVKVREALERVFGVKFAIHDSGHLQLIDDVRQVLDLKWGELVKAAGKKSPYEFVRTNEGKQVLKQLCDEARESARELVDLFEGTRLQ
ncbi:MAG: hypothetical protein R3B89_35130 [Polyangiaceae bacterium]